jgi:hypothetical protein
MFVGKPSYYRDVDNVDWAPSLNFEESVCLYDKIVAVCCIINNLNPGIVPFG